MSDDGENLPITPALFSELERMLDEALWVLTGFPRESLAELRPKDRTT